MSNLDQAKIALKIANAAIAAAENALAAAKIAGMQAEEALTTALEAEKNAGKNTDDDDMICEKITNEVDEESDCRLTDENDNFELMTKTLSIVDIDESEGSSEDDDDDEFKKLIAARIIKIGGFL